jgi:5'-nucleotidase
MEATILGIPAIAISYTGRDPELIEPWTEVLAGVLEQVLGRSEFPADTLLNINLPAIDPDQVEGVKVTTLGRREYLDSLTRAHDPSGREYLWIGGGESRWWGSPESDFRAIRAGYISVTPLHLDLTNYRLIREVSEWDLKL